MFSEGSGCGPQIIPFAPSIQDSIGAFSLLFNRIIFRRPIEHCFDHLAVSSSLARTDRLVIFDTRKPFISVRLKLATSDVFDLELLGNTYSIMRK